MNAATQRAKMGGPDLLSTRHPFRVILGDAIMGQFSNMKLAEQRAREYRGAVIWDTSTNPPEAVYKDGKMLEAQGDRGGSSGRPSRG